MRVRVALWIDHYNAEGRAVKCEIDYTVEMPEEIAAEARREMDEDRIRETFNLGVYIHAEFALEPWIYIRGTTIPQYEMKLQPGERRLARYALETAARKLEEGEAG